MLNSTDLHLKKRAGLLSDPKPLFVPAKSWIGGARLFLIFLVCFSGTGVTEESIQVGYGVVSAESEGRLPVASALFSLRTDLGVLVSEAGVPAVRLLGAGRIFVDQDGTRTGLALANPSAEDVTVNLVIRNPLGIGVGQTQVTLGSHEHLAMFVDEFFSELPPGFIGTLTFSTVQAGREVAAVTLRLSSNRFMDPLFATLPVAELEEGTTPLGSEGNLIVFPHIGAGGGILSTQIVLINRGSQTVRGQIEFTGTDGSPLTVELDGVSGSVFPFELAASGSFRGTVTRGAGVVQGHAVVTVEPGDTTPAGTAIFQFREGPGRLSSEAGVGATPAVSRARIFVDNAATRTGVAVSGIEEEVTSLSFDLLDRRGLLMGSTSRDLPARGQMAVFVDELFADLPAGFTGLLEIRSDRPVFPITLKLTINARNDLIVTTLPVADLDRPSDGDRVVFPQVGFGMGFATRLILINSLLDQAVSSTLEFRRSPDGSELSLPLGSERGSRFPVNLVPGGSLQLRPGNTAEPAAIIVNPASDGGEFVVNQGSTLSLNSIVIDDAGQFRDDFAFDYSTLSPEVASVDEMGRVTGNSVGFSSLTVTSGDIVQATTISVVETAFGNEGLAVSGVSRDLAGRTYLAASRNHTVRLLANPNEAPAIYAGTDGVPGFRDGERLQALFNGPVFLALNQADGSLYVSDQLNHVIRRVRRGRQAVVETVAGSSEPGSQDGSLAEVRFNNPSGVALDNRGNLWVADSGNHTIRRIHLTARRVETVAGLAGAPGFRDGFAAQARFNSPTGLAIEPEPLAEQLEREQRGDPPPAVSVLVADRNNGVIRRVRDDGTVTTLTGPLTVAGETQGQTGALRFLSPIAVAADSLGRIYVSEPERDQVTVVLTTGERVPVVQPGTLQTPIGISVGDSREVAIGVSDRGVVSVAYGEPEILEPPTPDGDRFVVRGRNFSSDATILIPGITVEDVRVEDTSTLSFSLGPVPNLQDSLLTVLSRAGVRQRPVRVFTDGSLGDPTAGFANFSPLALTLDLSGDILVAIGIDPSIVFRIRSSTGTTTRVAGIGSGDGGDGGSAKDARLMDPSALAADQQGNFYIADRSNNRIRRVDSSGMITTFAGDGTRGFSGDGGSALQAQLAFPQGVAVDPVGNLFISDTSNHRIRRVDLAGGIITTVAGDGIDQYSGDNGPAVDASLSGPRGIALDSQGNLFITDQGNNRIRRVAAGSGIITTVAGNGTSGFSGDGQVATQAQLNFPTDIALDIDGNLFIADSFNNRIRRVDVGTGTIATVVGNGGNTDNRQVGVPATDFPLFQTLGVDVDAGGNLVIVERSSFSTSFQVIRVNALTANVSTVLVEALLVD